MRRKKTKAETFMEEQLEDQEVAGPFYEGLGALRLSIKIAKLSEKQGVYSRCPVPSLAYQEFTSRYKS